MIAVGAGGVFSVWKEICLSTLRYQLFSDVLYTCTVSVSFCSFFRRRGETIEIEK